MGLEAKLFGLQLKIGEKYYGRNSRRGRYKAETLSVLKSENEAATWPNVYDIRLLYRALILPT